MKEIKVRDIQEVSKPGGTAAAKDTAALSAVMTALKNGKLDTTVKIVAGRS